MRYRVHRFNGEPPCRFEVYTMPSKVKRKANRNSGVRSSPGLINRRCLILVCEEQSDVNRLVYPVNYPKMNYPSLKALSFLLLWRILAQHTLRYLCSGISLHKTLRSLFRRDVLCIIPELKHLGFPARVF